MFTLAKRYPESKFVGVDIDPIKTSWCNFAIRFNGFSNQVKIIRQNILGLDLSDATGAFIFLSDETRIMQHLREKMFNEMKPGSLVVSYVHKFQSSEPSAQKGDLRLYIIPSSPSSAKSSSSLEARGDRGEEPSEKCSQILNRSRGPSKAGGTAGNFMPALTCAHCHARI